MLEQFMNQIESMQSMSHVFSHLEMPTAVLEIPAVGEPEGVPKQRLDILGTFDELVSEVNCSKVPDL